MKIVYLTSSTIPSRTANSIHVMKMSQAFAKNGHEVVLVTPDKKDELEQGIGDVYTYYGVEKCFEIVKLPWLNIKGLRYIYGFLAARKAKESKPDLVYCRDISGCYFAAKFDLPVMFESHTPLKDSGKLSEWLFHRLAKSHSLQKLVVITNALKKYYETNYPHTRGKILVAPDGSDPLPEDIQPVELPGKESKLQVGYVGHLYKGKGMELIAELAPHCLWANFNIVGGKEKDIQYWKNECDNRKNVLFHGYVQHSNTVQYIKAFDVVLLPNKNFVATNAGGGNNIAQWTSPMKAFEYMAGGKAIISSDLPVLREVLKHGYNSLLCPPDDVNIWETSLEQLRDDQMLRQGLGRNAYRDFLRNYTWHVRVKHILLEK